MRRETGMKKVNKLLHLVLGFSAGLLAGAFIRLGFEIIDGRPAAIGGEALILPLVILLVGFGFALGKEVKAQGHFSRVYEKGYRRGYHKGLEEGTAVLFSGVPCQVDGLKRYLGKDYPNLLTCDLVCHGVPSPAVFRAYLDGLEAARGSKVVSVRFKDKSHGWSHPWFTAQFADGSVYTEDFNRTGYGRGFGMQLFLRPACARCRYTSTSRPADFTLADYWGLDEKLALPVERDKGVSMVLVNSARGQMVFDALSPRFYGLDLRDETRLPQDLWQRREEDSLTGLFLREMEQLCAKRPDDPVCRLAARFGLAALENGEDICP